MAPKYIWDSRRLYEQQQFYMHEMGYTIADDYDPDGHIRHDSDPVAVYLTYLEAVRLGAVSGLWFSLEDFQDYIAGLKKPDQQPEPDLS
jgi:hypothetical protein